MADLPPKQLTEDIARVRLVLMRELETISHYEQLAAEAHSDELKAFFTHLAYEEKEHVAEATFLLRKLDAGQAAHFEKDFSQAHFEAGKPAAVVAAAASAPAPAPTAEPPSSVSTGILKNSSLPPHPQPEKMIYGVTGITSPSAGSLTVGPLKGRGD